MAKVDRDPVVDQWLRDEFGGEGGILQSGEQLSMLNMASRRPNSTDFPDAVLVAWRLALIRARRIVDQSEDAFIDRSLKQGYTWERIAEVLGHPTPEAAQRHHEHLKAELERTHPSVNEQIYRP